MTISMTTSKFLDTCIFRVPEILHFISGPLHTDEVVSCWFPNVKFGLFNAAFTFAICHKSAFSVLPIQESLHSISVFEFIAFCMIYEILTLHRYLV